MPRTIGSIQSAGVQVTERDAEQPITAADLGWAAYSGVLERGPTDELIWCQSKQDALSKTGNLISESHLPDNIRDYFDLAAGAGGLLLVRVTDGTEQPASVPLYVRRATRQQLGSLEAKNGGRWGGFANKSTGEVVTVATDITATTVITGITTWNTDQWKGGYIELAGVTNTRYEVISNTAAGVLTVASDATMDADLAGGGDPTNARWYLTLDGRTDRGLEFEIDDGENDPDNEFSLGVKLDGIEVARWNDLSVDDTSARYWVDIINDDSANEYVKAVDIWTGARPADVRPANYYGTHNTLTGTVLTADVADMVINSPTGGNPTLAMGTIVDEHEEQVITVTMTDPTTGTVASDKFGDLGTVTLGTLFDPPAAAGGALENKWAPPFTLTAGATPLVAADTLTISFKPVGDVNSLVGGFLYPDKKDNGDKVYRIVSNTATTITVSIGSTMDTDVAGGDTEFMVVAPHRLSAGRDGHADVADNDYVATYDLSNSLFKQLVGENLGLVKFACPGVTSTAVQKAGAAFVDSQVAGTHQWRYEVPSNLTTESAIEAHVNKTLGKSAWGDYVTSAQSFGYVNDPEADGKLKLISLTGMIHGREAGIAANWGGYHKAEAGVRATLPRLVKLTTGKRQLNEEFLNPRGINVIKQKNGQFVIWGNRTVSSNTGWKFKHLRETMSYYMNVLRENFDFSIFELNDPTQWSVVRDSLLSFFIPQYNIRALDNTFPLNQALVIKIDTENNTPLTQSQGDLNAEVTVRIVNAVERLRFNIGKGGVIPSLA